MTNSKKILITTVRNEILIVRHAGERQKLSEFCQECRALTVMFDFDSAVTIFDVRARDLMEQIAAGAIYSTETASGHPLVCQNSLQNFCK